MNRCIMPGSEKRSKVNRSEELRVGGYGTEVLKPRVKKGKKYVCEYLAREERDEGFDKMKMSVGESDSDIDNVENSSTESDTDVKDILAENFQQIKREFYRETPREGPYLVINKYKDQVLSLVANHQVIVLTGPTGCGKSTQVPLFILDSCMEKNEYCNIVVTQPRRMAATCVTKRVCNLRSWTLGSICGFKVGLVDRTTPQTLLTYMTTGVLLQTLIKGKSLNQYTHLIIDEIHERDQSMDMLLIVVKKLVKLESSNVKIILMSATAEAEKFSKYWSRKCGDELIPAPIITIDGRTSYTVDVHYLDDLPFVKNMPSMNPQKAYIQEVTYDICVELIKNFEGSGEDEEGKSSVLVFLPGISEIEHLYYKLKDPKVIGNGDYKWHVLPLHSTTATEDSCGIFRPSEPGYRKIIISTNLAESSVTVPGVKYVIDFCLVKRAKCDPTQYVQGLQLCWASQSNCVQRAGRTGRVTDGHVFRMVPRGFYEALDKESPSELSISPLEKIILQIKVFDMGEPLAILSHALDPPDLSDIEWSILVLKEAGALSRDRRRVYTPHDGELTFLGRLMAALPVDMYIAKLIAMGHIFGCLRECVIMGASMAVKSVFSYPFSGRLRVYDLKCGWADDSSSDCIALLNLFEAWTKYREGGWGGEEFDVSNWATSNFVHAHVFGEIDALVGEIRMRLKEFQIEEPFPRPNIGANDFERILILKVALAGAFYPRYFTTGFRYGRTYESEAVEKLEGRNPLSTVVLHDLSLNQPTKLYYELIGNYFNNMGCDVRLSSNKRTKIFVEFRHLESRMRLHGEDGFDETVPTEILREVYRAVQVGRIRRNSRIKTLPEPVACRAIYRTGCNSWNVSKSECESIVRNYIPCPVPEPNVSRINITISHIVNPGHFWALYTDNWPLLESVFRTVTERYDDLDPFERAPEPGRMCIAPLSKSGKTYLHRGTIGNVNSEVPRPKAEVFFLDDGSVNSIDVSDLKQYNEPLANDLGAIPGQAFECRLCELRARSVGDVKGQWTESSVSAFRRIIKGRELYGKVYSVVNGVVSLELNAVDEEGNDVNVNKFLIDGKYAEYAEEGEPSKSNHSLRMSEPLLRECAREVVNEKQKGQVWGPYPKSEEAEPIRLPRSTEVKGPESPLEVKLHACPRIFWGKHVVISDDSVNSVLLYTDGADRHNRLVVAGHSSQRSGNSNLIIYNITAMPNIHGLAALIPIMFCPEAEFRLNEGKNKLTGVLCGLGFDHRDGAGFFPEHDMELSFDTDITPDDITMVNALRFHMNELLTGRDTYQNKRTVMRQQNSARKIALMLLTKDRSSSSTGVYFADHRWGKISSSVSVDGKLEKSDEAMWSYRLHETPFMRGDFYN